ISSETSLSHRIRGTGPNRAPASDRNVPAWMSATRVPPPRSAAQSTVTALALSATGLVGLREVAVVGRRRRLGLALVLGAERWAAVGPLDRARHPKEADLADLHPEVEGNRQVGHVRELERQVAL